VTLASSISPNSSSRDRSLFLRVQPRFEHGVRRRLPHRSAPIRHQGTGLSSHRFSHDLSTASVDACLIDLLRFVIEEQLSRETGSSSIRAQRRKTHASSIYCASSSRNSSLVRPVHPRFEHSDGGPMLHRSAVARHRGAALSSGEVIINLRTAIGKPDLTDEPHSVIQEQRSSPSVSASNSGTAASDPPRTSQKKSAIRKQSSSHCCAIMIGTR
jgi:hypothetical protein